MIWMEGNIVSAELLEKLSEQHGQQPADFGLKKTERLADEISRCWVDAKDLWRIFSRRREKLSEEDSGVTETRNIWMVPLLQNLLGYQLQVQREAETVDGLSFAISHRDTHLDSFPVHIIGCNQKLDKRYDRQRQSAHSLMQDYLNRSENTYGIITNGLTIRLLRDNARLLKQQFVEWDVQRIIEEDRYNDFVLLFRLLHYSRMPQKRELAAESFLEHYHQTSIDEGNRIRDNLRDAVMKSLETLGNGFLAHPSNQSLRTKLSEQKLSPENFSRLLRRVVYRLLFLMVAEERELIFPSEDSQSETVPLSLEEGSGVRSVRRIYRQHYSISRFRTLAEKIYMVDLQQQNLWQELLTTFSVFEDDNVSKHFGIGALNGDLFSSNAISELNECKLLNRELLEALRLLSFFTNENGTSARINYKLLDVEELGSVYESLLDLHPLIETINGTLHFRFVSGMERKTTGSYYTRSDLVQEIIKSALEPVVAERVKSERKTAPSPSERAGVRSVGAELLKLKICDPACGSGHFLLAAARCIARELAKLRSGDEQPTPTVYRQCLREVIQHCIYGVDMNPDAVELCKLALWLESHNSGKPLSFLDHKIRCGNSLVGVTDMNVLLQPLPDEAYNPVTGDNKEVCRELKRKNREFRKTRQTDLFSSAGQQIKKGTDELQYKYHEIENIKQDSVADIAEMKTRFGKLRHSVYHEEQACNIWTAAFFKTYTAVDDPTNPTSEKLLQYFHAPTQYGRLVGEASKLAMENKFFHWQLEFPDVFEQGGFDCMVGNPPWESVQIEETQFFATKMPEISELKGVKRKKAIDELKGTELYEEFQGQKHLTDSQVKFIRESNRFPLTSNNKINTYSSFAELFYSLVNANSCSGLIIPTGIATDESTKLFFEDMVSTKRLKHLVGFENEEFIFPGVANVVRFCCLSISGKRTVSLNPKIAFHLRRLAQIEQEDRYFTLNESDLKLFNPNTKTCPIFRTKADYEIARKIYSKYPVLHDETKNHNPWNISFLQGLFNLTSDSNYFHSNRKESLVPLYEAKLFWHFDHRFASYDLKDVLKGKGGRGLPEIPEEYLADSNYQIVPQSWVEKSVVNSFTPELWERNWFLAFRDMANYKLERTATCAMLPKYGIGNSAPLLFFANFNSLNISVFSASFNSIVFDYFVRQKISGTHLNFFLVKQFPILPPSHYTEKNFHFIVPRVIELTYTAWDIKPFADDVWNEADEKLRAIIQQQHAANTAATGGHTYTPPTWLEHDKKVKLAPFKWSEERRATLKAELDAYYAKLYGLTEEELRYILCPQDVYGENFPGETFRVLKEKEERKYGEYRTRRLVMEAWEKLNS